MADRVFEDRVGLLIIDPARGLARLPAIAGFQGGLIRDVFFPRTASAGDLGVARAHGLSAHLWTASDGLSSADFAKRTLADVERMRPGACEANFEGIPDPVHAAYTRDFVMRFRLARPAYRLRLNTPPWKGFSFPADLLQEDRNLYAAEQNYEGNMSSLISALDVASDLTAYGVPAAKVTVCYAAACRVLGSPARQRTLPDLGRVHRGSIFSDDLMVEAGLL